MIRLHFRFVLFSFALSQTFCLDCSKTKRALLGYGIDSSEVPDTGFEGGGLAVCAADAIITTTGGAGGGGDGASGSTATCCTVPVERELQLLAGRQVAQVVGEHVDRVAASLSTQASQFDDFFRRMMNESRVSLDSMFVRTYGVLYQQNSFVFTDLFGALQRYYLDGRADLTGVMHHFFTTLYKHMFLVLNSQHKFDQTYLQCVAKHMEGLQPFGDVPTKLTQQLRRSFIATRTLLQALRTGAQLVNSLKQINIPNSCSAAVTRMLQCSTCQALPRLQPCNAFCAHVMHTCLSHYSRLDQQWQQYIDRCTDLIGRLEGPFNIESVVAPINVKISNAIMNFQDNGYDVSQKVFDGCGAPKFRRRRRGVNDAPPYATADSGARVTSLSEFSAGATAAASSATATTSLLHVLAALREKLRPLTSYWRVLSSSVCADRRLSAPSVRLYNCWNGTHKHMFRDSRALSPLSGSVFMSDDIEVVMSQLEQTSQKLLAAYNGQDVNWSDGTDTVTSTTEDGADSHRDSHWHSDSERPAAGSSRSDRLLEGSGGGSSSASAADIDNSVLNGLADDEDVDLYETPEVNGSGEGVYEPPLSVDDARQPPSTTSVSLGGRDRVDGASVSDNDTAAAAAGGGSGAPAGDVVGSHGADGQQAAPQPAMSLTEAVMLLARPALLSWLGALF